ncbi:MAG: secretin and TonB N-terminal domain-containing protein [Candidatus Omnitrophica bacterium]|nr:secretin and TonB N-terminal domain-containing protein [Candidatus Omnitrophota bacterium]
MKRYLLLITGIVFILLSFLMAEERSPAFIMPELKDEANPESIEEKRMSLDLRNIDIIDALKFLSVRAGLNIVPTKNVSGRISLTVENVPVKDVFDIMLRSNNLAYVKQGEIYNVMTEQEYKLMYGKNFSDMRQVKVFRLKYAIPEQAFNLLDAVKSEVGRLLVEPESGTVLLMDIPEKIAEAQKALAALEEKSIVKVFNLKYAKAKDVEEQLKSQLDLKKVGTIKADERSNQLIVQTFPERMKNIEELIKALDQKTKEVMIDTKIVKIQLSNQLDTGIEWEGLFKIAQRYGTAYLGSYPFSSVQSTTASWRSREQVLSDMAGSIGSYPFSGTTTSQVGTKISPGEKLHIGIISGKKDFDAVIKYLETFGKTKILSNPALTVINNQEAILHVGERRAYVTTTTTTGTATTTVSEEVTYVDIGIKLSIIPMINEEGYVTMKIKPEISSVIGTITSSSGNIIPIIDTSAVETTVMAKDGATIILGGLGKEEKTDTSEGIPILNRIPLLGFFFQNRTQKTIRSELLVMLTPIIIEGDKLITPKDKEKELFDIKAPKEFDVFQTIDSLKGQGILMGVSQKGIEIKNFKDYNEVIKEEDQTKERESKSILAKKESLNLEIKDLKKEAVIQKIKETLISESEEDEVLPKDFRRYDEK